MIRRQFVLIVLFSLTFQIFFSRSNVISPNTIESDHLKSDVNINNGPNNKCEPASVDEFPELFFNYEQRRRGGILIHIALILYSFAAIEIVCDDYFASALERISCNFNLTPVNHL